MSDTQKKIIGERLSQERARFSWSQTEAAERAGVGFSTYCAYEQGRSVPNAEALQQLAGYGVDVLFVITGQATAGTLTPDEMMLLGHWRDSPNEVRSAILGFYRSYASALRGE
ncbi:helix-turn-helix domain-containing protein [Chromobacterium alkanivorans]|uniref:helix-turn-helix domain-containing protein n=1 Tax=Chromobacterium alkanivorans TaxID=1071719 RepID=UPI001967B726|nr:helix-turn-helix transcriptional regulator [Chromobacterium alkanivorans]MBN3005600.1 helix-turn-helix domain-containing protein [Chromobacterium alkanivorans]